MVSWVVAVLVVGVVMGGWMVFEASAVQAGKVGWSSPNTINSNDKGDRVLKCLI